MTAYVDASVVLRLALGEGNRTVDPTRYDSLCTSSLTEVECRRTLDRIRVLSASNVDFYAERLSVARSLLARVNVIDLSPALLRRAGQHLPVPLGTLDAIHLATALSIGESTGEPFVLATHDRALARAARAVGLEATGD